MNWKAYYQGKPLIIATKHRKEEVIGPLLQKEFGFQYFASNQIDTDLLGTFSGEIERNVSHIQAAREKCQMAMEIHGVDVALSSEGSFGAHPQLMFVPAGTELLMFMDRKNEIEISVQVTSTETNFNWKEVKAIHELPPFLEQVKFPTHALIIKKSREDFAHMEKGINEASRLFELVDKFLKSYGSCILETDMRAMNNPTRMEQIEKLTYQLMDKMNSLCPHCAFPGFSVMEVQRGLLCSQCFLPTQSILKVIYRCQKCFFEQEKPYPSANYLEDPMYCDYCNP
ncbi:DUF6671 family protein [Aquirufa nivalisilvae]